MKHVKRFLLVTLVAFSLPVWAGGDSSDGHSHEAPAPLPVSQSVTPRAVAATEEFEVVTSLEGKKLVVYVDRFASNEPVVQAKVDALGARMSKHRPFPVISADDADWGEKRFARRMSSVLRAKMGQQDVERDNMLLVRDSMIRGTANSAAISVATASSR